jgi:hypothetical protein
MVLLMKKLLAIIIFMSFWSTVTYAKSISYVCEVTDDDNSKSYKEIFEIKNNKFFHNGDLLKTYSIKLNNTKAEVDYRFGSFNVQHKVNFKNGVGFEIWSKDPDYKSTSYLSCSVI